MQTEINALSTFGEFLEKISAYGELPALTDATDDRGISFAGLQASVQDIYAKLPPDIAQGSRVVLYGLSPLDWVPLFFACVLRGWIVVPLDTRVSVDFIASVEELTDPALVIVGGVAQLKTSRKILTIAEVKALPQREVARVALDPDAPCEILFTSGTWSRPKGVVLSQRNILTNAVQVLALYHHKQEDTSLAVLPLSHAYQQTVGLILPLLKGSHVVFLTALSSASLTRALQKYAVHTMLVVPRVLSLLQSAIIRNIKDQRMRTFAVALIVRMRFLPRVLRRTLLSSVHKKMGMELRTFISGGAPLSLDLDHFFQGLGYIVIVGYGASECAPVITISLDQFRKAGEIGKKVPRMEIELNEQHEMVVSGGNVFLGYWPLTGKAGSFNTEDIAECTKEGNFILKGRTKNLVVYPNGDKIFCEDAEYILKQIPDVEDCCVTAVGNGSDIQLYAVVKKGAGTILEEKIVRERVNVQLPFGIQIARVFFVDEEGFPYTHTLKVNRQRILQFVTSEVASALN